MNNFNKQWLKHLQERQLKMPDEENYHQSLQPIVSQLVSIPVLVSEVVVPIAKKTIHDQHHYLKNK
jgi:hypothetical protein